MNRQRYVILVLGFVTFLITVTLFSAQTVTPATPSQPAHEPEAVMSEPISIAELDAPPDKADALVVDTQIPGWVTRYGTQAGVQFLSPRKPVMEASPQGPQVPLGGWLSHSLNAGLNSITGITSLPDGRLVVGLSASGLRVYVSDSNGDYSWSEIHAGDPGGGPASDNITALGAFGNELWVGTSDTGLSIWDLDSGEWSYVTYPTIPSNYINRITVVSSQVALLPYVWVSTNGGAGLYSFSYVPPVGYQWFIYTTGNSGLPSNAVHDIAVEPVGGTAWFGTEGGIATLVGTTWTDIIASAPCDGLDVSTRIIVDRENAVWLSAWTEVPAVGQEKLNGESPNALVPFGVCRYANGIWSKFGMNIGLPSDLVSDMSVDSAGRVWMSLDNFNTQTGGGAVYDQDSWLTFKRPDEPFYNDRLNRVYTVGEAVWYGHLLASEVRVYSAYWTRYSASQMGGSDRPRAILVEAIKTTIGLGTGFTTIDGTFNWNYTAIPGNTGNVFALARDGGGHLWIGTHGNGVYAYDGFNFDHYTTAEGLPGNNISDLAVDHQGRLWAATNGGLAMRANGYWLTLTASTSQLPTNDLLSLTVDEKDRLWIGSNGSGIAILDPNTLGSTAWSFQDTGNGLPSNVIHSLTTTPSGEIWAGTDAGLGVWNSGTGSWAQYNVANGDLPGNLVLSLASDSVGRVWVGTDHGLALWESSAWTHYKVPGSALGSDHVIALGADEERVWVASGNYAAARGFINEPIGFYIPVINSFSPSEGAPFTQVTINGDHFDDRGPAYNKVSFYGFPWKIEAKVLSATSTQLVVEVPLLAQSGKVSVESHNLIGESANDFIIRLAISSLDPSCLGMGDELKIYASGLGGDAAAEVKIGNGNWRYADATDPTMIRTFIRPGDTAGMVSVRYTNNGHTDEATSSQSISIAQPQVQSVSAQQAIQGLPMIWEKATLVQLSLKSNGACASHISSGKAYWKLLDGSTSFAGNVFYDSPGLLTVTNWGNGVIAKAVGKPGQDGYFPQSQFDGMRVVLKNGPVDVITYDIPASTFGFVNPQYKRNFLNFLVIPPGITTNGYFDFRKDVRKSMRDVERIYPQHGSYEGHYWWYINNSVRSWKYGQVDLKNGIVNEGLPITHFSLLKNWAEDARDFSNDNGGNFAQAMAVIECSLFKKESKTPGKATIGYPSSVTFLLKDDKSPTELCVTNTNMAPTYLQEAIHAIVWVQSASPNHDGGNEYHSKYDEGDAQSSCNYLLTFRRALLNQMGYVPSVFRINGSYPGLSFQFPLIGCGDRTKMPSSAMSYAGGQYDVSSFLEPLDYLYTYCYVSMPSIIGKSVLCHQYAKDYFSLLQNGENLSPQEYATRIDFTNSLENASNVPNGSQMLRLNGLITQEDDIMITMSYLLGLEGEATPEDETGSYHLNFRASNGSLLGDFTFDVSFEVSHSETRHGGPFSVESSVDSHFSLHVPLPNETAQVQILHDTTVIWQKDISPNPPSVGFINPNGGTYNATDPIQIQWTASDPDGGELQFNLFYSSDNGITWQTLLTGLTGTMYEWTPYAIPAGNSVRLRLQASDGFNTSIADSAPFTLNPFPPGAIIFAPEEGDAFSEGQQITLAGGSITSAGDDLGTFDWYQDGVYIGSGITKTVELNFVGESTFELQVNADNMTASESVTIEVLPDYDQDGMPNTWELTYQLNPFDPTDVTDDPDEDSLTNLFEYQIGTNPLVADTDGDGFDDGNEVSWGSDPNDPGSFPMEFIYLPVIQR